MNRRQANEIAHDVRIGIQHSQDEMIKARRHFERAEIREKFDLLDFAITDPQRAAVEFGYDA